MAHKLFDIAVKTGEYTNSNGEKKGRWQNVGVMMQGDDGNQFLMLAKWFNPAGVPDFSGRNANSESVLLSLFEPKQQQGGQTAHGASKANGYAPPAAGADADVPF